MKSKGKIPKTPFSFSTTIRMIITCLLIFSGTSLFQRGYGQETPKSNGTENQEKDPVIVIPEFSELIPLASEIEVSSIGITAS